MNTVEKRNIFNTRLQEYIEKADLKKRDKYTIKNYAYKQIIDILKEKKINVSSKFKFWSKRTFYLVQIDCNDIVYANKSKLPLITQENIYDKITECHVSVGHSGRDQTWGEVKFYIYYNEKKVENIFDTGKKRNTMEYHYKR